MPDLPDDASRDGAIGLNYSLGESERFWRTCNCEFAFLACRLRIEQETSPPPVNTPISPHDRPNPGVFPGLNSELAVLLPLLRT